MDKIPIELSGPPQTMLATLYAKALDADADQPVLGDTWARAAVARIDYDWTRTTITPRSAPSVAVRSAHFDRWVRQFLAAHPRATVVHLGCGLDARVFRLDPGPGVRWYDVDYPDVIALRTRLYPRRDDYTTVAASVTDQAWLADIPADRPALLIAEGLTMYLTEADGIALLRRVVGHFGTGELQFDAFNRTGIRSQFLNAVVRRSGSRLHWAINEPADILAAVPGVRLLVAESVFDSREFAGLGRPYRLMARLAGTLPALHHIATYHRYAF